MLVPGLLVIYLGFDSGGYFAGITGTAAAALALLLAVRALTARALFSGLSPWTGAGLVAVAAFAALSLLSATWSHSPSRAVLSFDLVTLYLLLTVLQSSVRQPPERLRTLIYGLLAALVLVCGAGLMSRIMPHLLRVSGRFAASRLSYPVSYWNAFGMLCALGIMLCAHVSSDRQASRLGRVLAAGLVPAFSTALLLTFSRGAIAALAVSLAIYLLLCPRLTLLATAIATIPFSAIVVLVADHAGLLGTTNVTTPAAVAQGRHVATVLEICVVGSASVRWLLLLGERRLGPVRVRTWMRFAPVTVVIVAVTALLPVEVPWVQRAYRSFVHTNVSDSNAVASRLSSFSNNGRLEIWHVALEGFRREPLRGLGAGTFALQFAQRRVTPMSVQDAHSLYLQTFAELGVIGALTVGLFLLGLLGGAISGMRSRSGAPVAALAVAILSAWALHSAIDWDWQMPVVVTPVVALAAAVGAATDRRQRGATARFRLWRRAPRPPRLRASVGRLAVAFCCVGLGAIPALVAVSQSDLDASARAFAGRDCRTALATARAAHSILALRPEPLELIGYCLARSRSPHDAEPTMRQAVSRDPNDWEFEFALGIATAATGADPLPALRAAQRLNPLEPITRQAVSALRGKPRRERRQIALRLPLDVP